MDSIFTKIIRREIPATIELETDELIAFRDIAPQAPYHILIVPKRHISTVNDIQEADAPLIGKMVLAAKQLAEQYGFAENGYRIVMNCNADGGQTVFHIHLHLIGGKKLPWPP